MFMVLSSLRRHCAGSSGAFDECSMRAGWPLTLSLPEADQLEPQIYLGS